VTVNRGGSWPADPGLVDAFDTAALIVDLSGVVVHANEVAQRLFTPPGGALVGGGLLASLFEDNEQVAMADAVDQVLGGSPWEGRLEVARGDGARRTADVRCRPLRQGEDVVGLVCVVDDSGTDPDTLRGARRLGDSLTRLARVTAELVMADTVEAVTKIVTAHTADAMGATIAALTLRDGEDMLRLAGLRGGREGDAQQWARYSLDIRTPASDVVRTGERLVLTGEAAIAERYPDIPSAARGQRSIICLPLRVTARTIGAISLSFPGVRALDSAELDFLEVMADTCAQALDRINASEEAAKQTTRLTVLANASIELASSLDYDATLAKVARLAVPTFADWCAIDVVRDGRLDRVAVAHVDPAKVEFALELQRRYPPDPNAPTGPWNVVRTGRAELIPEVTDEMLVAAAVDEEQLRIARELHLRSALTVPLKARGKVVGVITWVNSESERLYGPDDVSFAEHLARRAASAIDNAELHSQTLAAADQLQRAVLPEALPSVAGWQVAHHYSPSGRTEVCGDFYDAVVLADGRLLLFVGDVMGRGVAAAAAMAQVRAAVRAYAVVDPTPEVVMRKLDLMFAQYGREQLVTLVYMVANPEQDELLVANAGHPPPLILRRDLGVEQLPLAGGPPLGAAAGRRGQSRVTLSPGDTLLAFTDGLIERRDEDIDAGLERLHRNLPLLGRPDLPASLARLVERMRDPSQDDDVAALAAQREV
jgi:GAF domain-containing protein